MSQEEKRTSGAGREQPRERTDHNPPRKKRRKKRISALGTLLYVAFVIGASTLLAAVGWVCANDVLALNKEAHSAVITLSEDVFTSKEVVVEEKTGGGTSKEKQTVQVADIGYVADLLKENGLIEHKLVFRLYAAFSHAEQKMAPGTYQLDTDMDYRAIVTNLGARSSTRQKVTVTIPEGFTVEQTFQRLAENGVSTVAKLNEMAASYDYNFSFLKERPLGQAGRLEGYLFPDTYEFYMNEDPKTVINKMLVNFDRRFDDDMRAAAQAMGYSVHDIVTIASMIEKETDGTDRARIASVIYNRLTNTGAETAGYLGIDATLVYALGRTITQADYTADTLYNTYTYRGLPPGPIANPGMASITAAMNPESTNNYYYALGNDGKHEFFRTLRGQQDFLAQQAAQAGS